MIWRDLDIIESWLDSFNWFSSSSCDIDNKIMNIGCLLQYSRDEWDDNQAHDAIEFIKQYLLEKINPSTGIWTSDNPDNPEQLSRMVQFSYHLFPLFFYDNYYEFDCNQIIGLVLKTQNKFGGFGVKSNSSACEDMDSIDLLIRFRPYVDEKYKQYIDSALRKA